MQGKSTVPGRVDWAARIAAAASRDSTRVTALQTAAESTTSPAATDESPTSSPNAVREQRSDPSVRDSIAVGIKVCLVLTLLLMFFAPELAGVVFMPVLLLFGVALVPA